MFRQRQLASLEYKPGQVTRQRLPNDAVYHQLQLSCFGGLVTSTFTAGTNTGPVFASDFPACLIRDLRIIRNGGDIVWQGSGAQFFKEHLYLNKAPASARLYNTTAQAETLLTQTVRGVSIPSNSQGIAADIAQFVGNKQDTAGSLTSVMFDFQAEMWFQLPLEGKSAVNTLVDARKLATFDIEITWNDVTAIMIPGTNNTANAITAIIGVSSSDQDSVSLDEEFGTFKRTGYQYSNFAYGSSNNQINLPRGNLFLGMLFSTRAYKANSTLIPQYENSVISQMQNRINTSYQLRIHDFKQLQAKNMGDGGGGRHLPYSQHHGAPQGWAAIEYSAQLDNPGELIKTYVADQFDILLSINAASQATNGTTTAATLPVIDVLTQEVIPGRTTSGQPGLQAGSTTATSAKPYTK